MNDILGSMTEEASSPTLAYNVPRRRRLTWRIALASLGVIALAVTLLYAQAPLLRYARQRHHTRGLEQAMRNARAASAAGDRVAMGEAWQRMHQHHSRLSRLLGGIGAQPLPPNESLLIVERTTTDGSTYLVCVGRDTCGLLTESWAMATPGQSPSINRVDTRVAPLNTIWKLRFGDCRSDPAHRDQLLLDYMVEGRSGTVIMRVKDARDLELAGSGWAWSGRQWHPGSGTVELLIAPPATWELNVGRDFVKVSMPDNEHVALVREPADAVFVFPVNGSQPPQKRPRASKLGGLEGAFDVIPHAKAAAEPLRLLLQECDQDFLTAALWPGVRSSADGRLAAAAGHESAFVWTNATPVVAYRLPLGRTTRRTPAIALSSDGATLAIVASDWSTALVWDLRSLPGLSAVTRSAK